MGSWDYEFAKKFKSVQPSAIPPSILEGTVARVSPLTVSLCGGEVMAPPLALSTVAAAQGFYRDKDNHHLYLEEWAVGDRVCCAIMGGTVVILGRLVSPSWTIPER